MKTITLDYETYEQELSDAHKNGVNSGLYKAVAYIQDPDTYQLRRNDHYSKCEELDKAIADRVSDANSEYLEGLIERGVLTVFNHDNKTVEKVTGHIDEMGSITLYIGLGT